MKLLAACLLFLSAIILGGAAIKCGLDAHLRKSQDYSSDVAASWLLSFASAACLLAAILIVWKA